MANHSDEWEDDDEELLVGEWLDEDDGDEGSDEEGPDQLTIADIELNDSHAFVKTNREGRLHLSIDLTWEVIEPPNVYDAEIHRQIKQQIRDALLAYRSTNVATITGFKVSLHSGVGSEDDE